MKFDTIVLQVNTDRLTESDFWYDVTLSIWRPWRHFTPSGECICIVCRSPTSNYVCSSWSIVHSY